MKSPWQVLQEEDIYLSFTGENLTSFFWIDFTEFLIFIWQILNYNLNLNVPLSMIGMSVNQNIRFLTVSYVIKTKQEKRLTFQQSRLFIFFLMDIFLNHLWLIPNILKWQNCKIFTKLVPSQTLLRSSNQKCSAKKRVFKNLRKHAGKHLYWSLFLIKPQALRPASILNNSILNNSDTDVFL